MTKTQIVPIGPALVCTLYLQLKPSCQKNAGSHATSAQVKQSLNFAQWINYFIKIFKAVKPATKGT